MKTSILLKQKKMKFKQWKHHSAAIFKSLKQTVLIAVLTIATLASFSCSLFAQTDTVFMEEVEIRSSRMPILIQKTAKVVHIISKEEIEILPANNLSHILDQVASTDVRSRGADGIQSDISIRGGNFEQTLILLNGININDVQTGHHNMNIPVNLNDIEKIEILQGPGNRFFGLNAYSGAINIITKQAYEKSGSLSGFYGSNSRFGTSSSASFGTKKFRNYLSATYSQSDGYLTEEINNTDYKTGTLFYGGQIKIGQAKLNINAGYIYKAFGANDFYTPSFPWQYEAINTYFASAQTSFGNKIKILPSIYYRRHQDRFELFREDIYKRTNNYFINGNDTAGFGNGYYYSGHNHHLTNVYGGKIIARLQSNFGKTSLGTDIRSEQILSNILGKDMNQNLPVPGSDFGFFSKSSNRNRINIFTEHYINIDKIAFSAGVSFAASPDFNPLTTGGADISYTITRFAKLYVSFNRSARLPSFTDLYYAGPTNIGNPDLKPETALSYEIGLKKNSKNFSWYINTYLRNGHNTIDWIKTSETDKWQSQNLTELKTIGGEAGAVFTFQNKKLIDRIRISYAYNNSKVKENYFISKYVLDYMEHQLKLSVNHRLIKNFNISWHIKVEDRAGSYTEYSISNKSETEYSPFILADAKINYAFGIITIFGELSNILNTEYHEISSVVMPGRRFRLGMEINL